MGKGTSIRYIISGLFKGVLIKLFPSLSYRGVVNTQIRMYKKLMDGTPEQKVLNFLIRTRMASSFGEEDNAMEAYGQLLYKENKTLEDVIKAIVYYEYIDSPNSKGIVSKIPPDIMDKFK